MNWCIIVGEYILFSLWHMTTMTTHSKQETIYSSSHHHRLGMKEAQQKKRRREWVKTLLWGTTHLPLTSYWLVITDTISLYVIMPIIVRVCNEQVEGLAFVTLRCLSISNILHLCVNVYTIKKLGKLKLPSILKAGRYVPLSYKFWLAHHHTRRGFTYQIFILDANYYSRHLNSSTNKVCRVYKYRHRLGFKIENAIFNLR